MVRLNKKTPRSSNTTQFKFPESFHLPEESARRYQDIFDNASDAIFIRDLEGNTIEVNEAAVTLTGYTVDELTGMNLSKLLTADSYKLLFDKQKALLEDGNVTQRYEIEIIRKDGIRITAEARTSLFTNQGWPLGVQCIVRDITERKQIENALRASEERFRIIYEESPIGIALYDFDGKLVTANRACLDILGVSDVTEVRGFNLFEYPNVTDEVKQRLSKGETVRYETFLDFERITRQKIYSTSKSGIINLNLMIKPLDVAGEYQLGGYLAQVQDITGHKRAEEELRIAEQNFRNSLDNSPLGVRIYNTEYETLYANQAILDIFGENTIEDLKSIPMSQRYTPESYTERQERREKREKGEYIPPEFEVSIVREDGGIRYLEAFRKEVIWNGKTQIQTLYQDITERKRVEEDLRVAEQNFRNSLDNSPLGVRIYNTEHETLYANQAVLDIFGESIEELNEKPIIQRYTPESYAEYLKRKARRDQGKYVSSNFEVGIVRKDGGIRYLEAFRKEVIWNGKTQIQSLYQDITERKRMETALRQSEEFNSSLLTNSPTPIVVLNTDASIKYVNPAMEKLTGFSAAEIINCKPPYPWWREEALKESYQRLARFMRRGSGKSESLFRKKSGELFWVEKVSKTVKTKG